MLLPSGGMPFIDICYSTVELEDFALVFAQYPLFAKFMLTRVQIELAAGQ
jgi:hypothetical protein